MASPHACHVPLGRSPVLTPTAPEARNALSRCDKRSVGLIVRAGPSILLIRRNSPPFGFAAPAGHVDQDDSFATAARRELEEEVGLTATSLRPVYRALHRNACRRPLGRFHYWAVYQVDHFTGTAAPAPREVKSIHWLDRRGLAQLADRTRRCLAGRVSPGFWCRYPGLEPVWLEILSALGFV